jgi:hypothetical protein
VTTSASHAPHVLLMSLVLLSLTACTALPSERQVKQFLGLERVFGHNDVPAPPTPSAFVLQSGMGQTKRIVIRSQQSAVLGEVTDPQAIQAVLGVFRSGAATRFAGDTDVRQAPFQLDFLMGAPERLVTAHYNPASQTLQLYNLPTAAWPDHAVASYTMTPAFGAALQQALAHGQSRATP